jgi:hypothetical protein
MDFLDGVEQAPEGEELESDGAEMAPDDEAAMDDEMPAGNEMLSDDAGGDSTDDAEAPTVEPAK